MNGIYSHDAGWDRGVKYRIENELQTLEYQRSSQQREIERMSKPGEDTKGAKKDGASGGSGHH